MSRHKPLNLFKRKILIQIFCIYIVRNIIKPRQTQMLNCIHKMHVNHSKILTSQELCSRLALFGLKSFHGFVILAEKIEPTAFIVFYFAIKMQENCYKKPNSSKNSSKNIKKTIKLFQPENTKGGILFHRYLSEYTVLLTLSVF